MSDEEDSVIREAEEEEQLREGRGPPVKRMRPLPPVPSSSTSSSATATIPWKIKIEDFDMTSKMEKLRKITLRDIVKPWFRLADIGTPGVMLDECK